MMFQFGDVWVRAESVDHLYLTSDGRVALKTNSYNFYTDAVGEKPEAAMKAYAQAINQALAPTIHGSPYR